jgi:hypothetical protein
MVEVGLRLHPDKTRIVYCKGRKRSGAYEHTSFTFLGYTFGPRGARAKTGACLFRFSPAVSRDALKKTGREVRSWRLHYRTGQSFSELARRINPIVHGWMNYLRRLLSVSAVSPSDTHQRLPDAVGPQEVPAIPRTTRVPAGVEASHHTVPVVFRSLGLDHRRPCRLVIKVTRAV